MAHFISVSTMFSATPFSAIYEDTAHPSFLDRSQSIIDDALLDKDCGARLREYFRLGSEDLARAKAISRYRVVELVLSEPIYDVSFNTGGLVLVPENPAHLYYLPTKDILDLGKGATRAVSVSQANAVVGSGFPELGPGDTRQYGWNAVWSTPSAGTYGLRPGQTFVSDGGFWRHAPSELESRLSKYSIQSVSTPPEPSSIAIVEAWTPRATNVLISLCDGKVCAERETHTIAGETTVDARYTFVNTVTDDYVYLEAHDVTNNDGLGSLRGVIVLDSRTLLVKRVIPLKADVCSTTTEATAVWDFLSFVVVPTGESERFICIANRHGTPDRWYAWELKPGDQLVEKVVSAPFVVAVLHKSRPELDDFERRNYLPSGLSAKWIGGNHIILQLFHDSAWLLDIGTKQASILFHPGGEATRIVPGRTSLVVFYRGGYKCYLVVSPSADDNRSELGSNDVQGNNESQTIATNH